jgi:hypothetical protein
MWLAKAFHVLRGFRSDHVGPTGFSEQGAENSRLNDFPFLEGLTYAEEMQKQEFGQPLEIFSQIGEFYLPDSPGSPADFIGAFGDDDWGAIYDFWIKDEVAAEILTSSEIMFSGDGGRVMHGMYISLSWRAERGQTDGLMEILAKNCVR